MIKQNQMIEDNFIVEQESSKGPYYLLPSQRIANLQNQVIFFEGQVDPLQWQNFNLKQNVVRLARQVSLNTDVLRRLLPNQNDPVKKHKLEMASFTEVTQSIDQTWKMMENELAVVIQSQKQLKKQLQDCKASLQQQQAHRHQQKLQYQSKILLNESKYGSQISSLQGRIAEAEQNASNRKKEYEQELKIKEKLISKYQRQQQFLRHDSNSRSKQYESTINRLKNNIEAFLRQSQQSKISLKALYQKMSNQKLTEQGETYELMLKIKQEEKRRIQGDMIDMKKMQQKELSQKESQVQRIRDQLQRQTAIVNRIEDELYQKREQMKGVRNQTKQMRDEIIILKQNCIIFESNVKKRQDTILQLQNELASTICEYDTRIKFIEQAHKRQTNQLNKQKNKLLQIINSLQSELRDYKTRIKQIEEQFTAKNKLQIQSYKAKQLQLLQIIQRHQNDIKLQKQKAYSIQQQKDDEVRRWKQHFQSVIKKMEKDFQKQRQEVIKELIIKAARQSAKVEQQQIKYRLQCQMQIENTKRMNLQEIKRIRQEFFQLINQKELAFQRQKKSYQQKIQVMLGEQNNLNEQINKLNKKIQQGQQKLQKMKANHIRQIAKLQQKNNQAILTWQNTLSKQLDEFQKVMMERQMKIGQMEDSFIREKEELHLKMQNQQKEIVQTKSNLQLEMKSFKEKTGIREVEVRFQDQIKSLKVAALAREKQKYLTYIKEKSLMIEDHTRDKNNLIASYTKELNKVEKQLEQTLININILLLRVTSNEGFEQPKKRQSLSHLNNAVKIQHIQGQVKTIEQMLQEKKEQLVSAMEKLQRIERSIEEALIERKEEIERERISIMNQMQFKLDATLKQYNCAAALKEEQYRLKQQQLQKERVRFVQLLHQEFKNLRASHEKDYTLLLQKYIEIQNHFESRPSRSQDIAKIKELTIKNNKLSRQVVILQKRYDTANEIVKYLNLQLQNYKEMYDIFKPSQMANKTISFNFDPQKAEKYQRIMTKLKDQHNKTIAKRKHASVDITPFFQQRVKEEFNKNTKNTEGNKKPIQLFLGKQFKSAEKSQDQEQLGLQSKQSQKKAVRKYSFAPLRNRLKTETSPDKQREIFQNTQTFLKLANVQVNDNFPKQLDKKQSYRRRKIKRMSTVIQQMN